MSKKYEMTVADNSIAMSFGDVAEAVSISLADLTDEVVTKLALHGLKQKLADAMAGREVKDGAEHVAKVAAGLLNGDWSVRAPAAPGTKNASLVEALFRATGQDREQCETVIAAMTEDQVKELRKHPAIKVQLAQIRIERESKKLEESGAGLGSLFG